jgi:hypothetical protein
MKRLYIWGMLFWSLGWLFWPPNPDPSPTTFVWFAVIGSIAILTASFTDRDIHRLRWHPRLLVAAAALAIFGWWWFDLPYLGPLFLAAGALTLIAAGNSNWGARLGDGLVTTGSVALWQLIGYYIYYLYVGPRSHGCAIPGAILASAFRLFGINASTLSDGLHIFGVDRLYQVVPSPANMGVYVFLMLLFGLIGLAVTGKIRVRSIFIGTFVLGVFALARYAAVVLWDYNQNGMIETFWSTRILAWTVWPVGFFLHGSTIWKKLPAADYAPPIRNVNKRLAWLVLATLVGVFAWTAYEGYYAPGVKKQGRLMIDEFHSNWEWTQMPFDTVWYGQQSTYNFYCLADWWDKYFTVKRQFDSITPAVLDSVDVLFLKVPTSPYSKSEIDAIQNWVAKGGGLFLLGEHTNVFGYATFLNPVAERFGLRYIPDIVYELKTGDLNLHETRTILPHPVAQNLPPFFLFGGPCSMWGDLSVRPIITDMQLKTLEADYTQRNFFPERAGSTGYRNGIFFLSLSTRYGKGRIVTFTDSTLWSNFFVFIPGKPELALGLVDYANRYEGFPYWRILTFLLGVVSLLVGAFAAAGLRREGWLWFAAVGCLVFGGSSWWIMRLNRANYVLPKPHTQFAQLNFESTHSRFFVPELRLAREADKDFSTFYLWTQRVGIVPRKWPTFEASFAQPGSQMIIDPEGPFSDSEMTTIHKFVEDGGTLFVLDDPGDHTSSSNMLLAPFGLHMELEAKPVPYGLTTAYENVLWQGGGRVSGGQPILADASGSALCAIAKIGKGQVVAFANSHIFERKTMGYTAMIPNPTQNTISQFEYKILSYLNYPPAQASRAAEEPSSTAEKTE